MIEHEKAAHVVRYKPYYYKLVPGKTYSWCACGLSKKQPFCDGSHRGTDFEPVKYVANTEDREVLFCGCKHTENRPFCDGTHNNLRDTYEEDDPYSDANRNIPEVRHRMEGRLELNGRCYVARVDREHLQSQGNVSWITLISAGTGARHQSQFFFEISSGSSSVIDFGDRHVVLLATAGTGTLNIGPESFDIVPEMGAYVRPGESFKIKNSRDTPICLYASVCPLADEPRFSDQSDELFDHSHSQRTVAFDPEQRQRMGDRTFQILVDKGVGSDLVTQFIGDIPLSKAAPHRHLYEESLILLNGEGCMWTEDMKAAVKPGDVIFLPAQQIHSLQCIDPNGMVVAGVIYPGGNPDINY